MSPSFKKVLEFLRENPLSSRKTISEKTGVAYNTLVTITIRGVRDKILMRIVCGEFQNKQKDHVYALFDHKTEHTYSWLEDVNRGWAGASALGLSGLEVKGSPLRKHQGTRY